MRVWMGKRDNEVWWVWFGILVVVHLFPLVVHPDANTAFVRSFLS